MKKKNRNYKIIRPESEAEAAKKRKDEAFKKNKKYILPLLLNTALSYGVYALLANTEFCIITLWVYFVLLLGFASAYIIYNRAFSRRGVTVEMLPDSMSDDEKREFIADGERRLQKSKWMILIIFPLVMTFIIDTMLIFMVEPLAKAFGL